MRIIAKSTLASFWKKHGDCEQQLLTWYQIFNKAKYNSFDEVSRDFGTMKIVGPDRMIFRIKGNNYRLVVKVTFKSQIIYVRFIGTHREYDDNDAKTI